METMGFARACKQFFGLKPGETITEFAQEIKALTQKDKEELAEMLSVALGAVVTLTAPGGAA